MSDEVRQRSRGDRIARLALGIVLLYLGWSDAVAGTLGTVLQFLGFVPLATGLPGGALYMRFSDTAPTPTHARH